MDMYSITAEQYNIIIKASFVQWHFGSESFLQSTVHSGAYALKIATYVTAWDCKTGHVATKYACCLTSHILVLE